VPFELRQATGVCTRSISRRALSWICGAALAVGAPPLGVVSAGDPDPEDDIDDVSEGAGDGIDAGVGTGSSSALVLSSGGAYGAGAGARAPGGWLPLAAHSGS
jgi:hypothetical protein